jgi:hypothetical protein
MVTMDEGADEQPETLFVNVNWTLPADNAVTRPALLILAIVGLLLTQVPPVFGRIEIDCPTQREEFPLRFTCGISDTLIVIRLPLSEQIIPVVVVYTLF